MHLQVRWESLQLVVEPHGDHWQTFVYDEEQCAILYHAERITANAAKEAAVEFALHQIIGPGHGMVAEAVAQALGWRPAKGNDTQRLLRRGDTLKLSSADREDLIAFLKTL